MSKRQSIEGWISQEMADANSDNEKVSAISLVHKASGGDIEIHTIKFGGKAWAAKDLADIFQSRGEQYTQDLPGVQTLCLYMFYESSANEVRKRHPIALNGITDYGGFLTEAPDDRGMRQQGMRLTEALVTGTFRQVGIVFQADSERIQSQAREIQDLRAENRETFLMLKEMLIERDRQDHERKMKEMEYARSSQERKQWLSMIPLLTNTLAGREVFPQTAEDTALIEGVAEYLMTSPDRDTEIMKLASVVPPMFMGPLAARLQKYEEQKRGALAKANGAAS